MTDQPTTQRTGCLVVGGGPAGMVLGLLLARGGVEVTVLEKHGDFLRDFRGDTVHPTTLDLLDELGLGEEFERIPHRRIDQIQLPVAGGIQQVVDISGLRGKHNYIAMVPQWDLLDLLARAGAAEPTFTLRMNTEATDLLVDGGKVTGVRYRTADGGTGEITAGLTVACDGRGSVLRRAAGLMPKDWPTPMDAWWFRLPRRDSDPAGLIPVISHHRATVMIDRGDYWQCAVLIHKGSDPQARTRPVEEMVATIAEAIPWIADRVDAVASWDEVRLLDVKLDRLRRWYRDGLLCIGDAAHAMSPVGGIGINLAVQDAVATARLLAAPLRDGTVGVEDLARVQRRRTVPTMVLQGVQRLIHERALRPALDGRIEIARATRVPLPVRILGRLPFLRTIPAYVFARGPLPEHAPDFARREPVRT